MTRHARDKSALLEHIANAFWGGDVELVLGEQGLAFAMFAVGESEEALKRWMELTVLFCSCSKSLGENPRLFASFASVLSAQLSYDDSAAEELGQGFLPASVQKLFINAKDLEQTTEATRAIFALATFAQRKFGWAFEDEEDDLLDMEGTLVICDDGQ